MANSSPTEEPLILALRVGITGTRDLSPGQLLRITEQVTAFLRNIKEEVTRLAVSPETQAVYGDAPETRLVSLSPLAEGSDRLLAKVALEQGFALICPLPFARSEYEKDFQSNESKNEFRTLLTRAEPSVLELDGERGEARDRSYEAVGRYVVRNCDILVAIWDGKPGHGLGGTADIVRFAVNHGPPVWWIHSDNETDPTWLVDGQDFRKAARQRPECEMALRSYLTRLLVPPAVVDSPAITWFERAAKLMRRPDTRPFPFYRGPPTKAELWIWRAHAWFIQTMAGIVPASPMPSQEPADKVAGFWFSHYHPADAWAGQYARRYRSTYVWVFGLATVAVIFASIALVVPSEPWIKLTVAGIEFVALALIAAMVFANEKHRWHRLFLEYRLLAELCRKQQMLALFGWSLQGPSVTEKLIAFETGAIPEKGNWVGWLFGTLQRAAPLPQGKFDRIRTGQSRDEVLRDLIEDQLTYHRTRAIQSQHASERLGKLGEWFFIAVLALVAVKLVLVASHAHDDLIIHRLILALGLAAAILPALSAGFVGIRSYAELPILADQSRRMQIEMQAARDRIQQIDVGEPLASQILGSEIFGVATLMLQDIQGWMQLFRAKVVEPG
jgi:hypothetical protein